jgi:hypothetical protein
MNWLKWLSVGSGLKAVKWESYFMIKFTAYSRFLPCISVPLRIPDSVSINDGSVSSRSVEISWKEYPCKDRNGPNGTYNIHVYNLENSSVRILDPMPLGNVLQTTITRLIPYTQYAVVFIFATNVTLNFRTLEEGRCSPDVSLT